jgi:hypothetical protein
MEGELEPVGAGRVKRWKRGVTINMIKVLHAHMKIEQ